MRGSLGVKMIRILVAGALPARRSEALELLRLAATAIGAAPAAVAEGPAPPRRSGRSRAGVPVPLHLHLQPSDSSLTDTFTVAPKLALLATATAMVTTLISPSAAAAPIDPTATVLRVVDGDTIDIRDDMRGRLRVRVLGIDTPETNKPGYTVGCWGPEATEFAKSTMLGQRVALLTDPTQDRTDRYGRLGSSTTICTRVLSVPSRLFSNP
jgi:micrococcal nuclease